MPISNIEYRTSKLFRTRFAPSPTGYLHVGGVRTALFAWLVAKQAKGQFILRIEDTDRSRHVEEAEQHIIDSLGWLGMQPDEPPVRQSERLDIYKKWAKELIETGRAYADSSTPEELEALRRKAADAKKPFLFRDHRPDPPAGGSPVWDESMPLRFKSEPKSYSWHDEVMGNLSAGPEVIDDFIILKSDGYPTYNFAHIVDDHEMHISHVIRSQEFLPSVPKFLNLYEALAIERPKLATLPYVMAPGGRKKLSKRDGAKDILDYQREGYLPEALINFLATLGWNDGTEQEIFSVAELIKKFDLSRVQKSGAHFDEQRLLWMNGHYIRQLTIDELGQKAKAFWPNEAKTANESYKKAVLELVQERLKFLAELAELTKFFFEEPQIEQVIKLYKEPVDKYLKKEPPDFKKFLEAAVAELSTSDFSVADIQKRLNKLLKTLHSKPAILFPVIRIAASGSQISPELFGTLHVLGKAETLKRLSQATSSLET
ncbi:glutamate--tRNA ligase [Candidatus Saccharibacteria bacterium]|nr:glutamate--tRNA ligase [Candidatus Saccharibacteria bacterium]